LLLSQVQHASFGCPKDTFELPCYTYNMTELLHQAIQRLQQLPPAAQDSAARALMQQLEEEPEPGDREALEEGRREFGHGSNTY
jgi:hypothetical protein